MADESKRRESIFERKDKRILFQIQLEHKQHNSEFHLPSDRSIDSNVTKIQSLRVVNTNKATRFRPKSPEVLIAVNLAEDTKQQDLTEVGSKEEEARANFVHVDSRIKPSKFGEGKRLSAPGVNSSTGKFIQDKPQTRYVQQSLFPKIADNSVKSNEATNPLV